MRPLVEIILSLLAVMGLAGLGWLALGHLLTPVGGGEALSLVLGKGDGEHLEQTVRGLAWLRGGGFLAGPILIVDGGLTPAGRAVAAALCLQEPGVEVCPLSELSVSIKQMLKQEKDKDSKPS